MLRGAAVLKAYHPLRRFYFFFPPVDFFPVAAFVFEAAFDFDAVFAKLRDLLSNKMLRSVSLERIFATDPTNGRYRRSIVSSRQSSDVLILVYRSMV